MAQVEIRIEGMSCQNCVNKVTGAVARIPGVTNVTVSLEPGSARVTYDDRKTGVEALRKAISDAGFTATAA